MVLERVRLHTQLRKDGKAGPEGGVWGGAGGGPQKPRLCEALVFPFQMTAVIVFFFFRLRSDPLGDS